MDAQSIRWIKDQLTNNEYDGGEELVRHFTSEGVPEAEARAWVGRRSFYATNIVVQDEDGNDVGIYDPKTRSVKPVA